VVPVFSVSISSSISLMPAPGYAASLAVTAPDMFSSIMSSAPMISATRLAWLPTGVNSTKFVTV
jgi:hypothetical protein